MLSTGLSFAVFGLFGSILGLLADVFIRVIIPDPDAGGQVSRRLISRAFLLFVNFMSWIGVIRWRMEGRERWSDDQPGLIIANHPSLIDVVFLLGIFQGADCVVKESVIRNPFWGRFVRRAGYVSNADTGTLITEVVARLRQGRKVILFPEGTRSVPGAPLAFKPVAAAIALQAQVSCLPVAITCNPPTLYKGCPWYRVPKQRAHFTLRLCEPIETPSLPSGAALQRQAARDHTRLLETVFNHALQTV